MAHAAAPTCVGKKSQEQLHSNIDDITSLGSGKDVDKIDMEWDAQSVVKEKRKSMLV